MKKNKKKSSGRRIAMKILCTVLAVVLAGMLGATGYAYSMLNKLNHKNTPSETMPQAEIQEYLDEIREEDSVSAPTMSVDDVDWGDVVEDLFDDSDRMINVLLIGQDRRPGETRARSDSMILCTINRDAKSITLTSFLRDLYVKIPGSGSNRINASYAWGGMELLNATIKENFGITVDGNVEVDFNQFADIVDLLGGVTLEIRSDEASFIQDMGGGAVKSGLTRLNGTQALCYARIRSLDGDGDFSRTNRQRKVLNSMIEEAKKANLVKLLSLMDQILPMVTTDMTNTEIMGYATKVFPMLSDATITSQRIPADGTYYCAMIDGMSVLVADMDNARSLLKQTLGN